jgi:hypothetical protein
VWMICYVGMYYDILHINISVYMLYLYLCFLLMGTADVSRAIHISQQANSDGV